MVRNEVNVSTYWHQKSKPKHPLIWMHKSESKILYDIISTCKSHICRLKMHMVVQAVSVFCFYWTIDELNGVEFDIENCELLLCVSVCLSARCLFTIFIFPNCWFVECFWVTNAVWKLLFVWFICLVRQLVIQWKTVFVRRIITHNFPFSMIRSCCSE